MKKNILLLVILLMVFMSTVANAASQTVYDFQGTGQYNDVQYRFYAQAYGSATIKFTQSKGQASERSVSSFGFKHETSEWGMYYVRYRNMDTGSSYTGKWNNQFHGETFSLSLPGAGRYEITVTPFTNEELNKEWYIDSFKHWADPPRWWVQTYSNCSISLDNPPPTDPPTPLVSINWVSGYQKEQTDANRLIDGRPTTAYQYTIYRSEFQDNGHIELSFGLNGGNVSRIYFTSGDSSNFYRYSRPKEIRVHIYTNNGSYTEYLYLEDMSSTQTLSLSRTYKGVNQVDMDILHTYDGSDINFVKISEVEFN